MKSIAVGIVVCLVTGCATKEGIALPVAKPTQSDVADFTKRNSSPSNAGSTKLPGSIRSSIVPEVDGARLIVIGNTMALTKFKESALNQRYNNYLKQIGNQRPAFTREWYLSAGAGETAVRYSGVTGIYTRFYKAEIPKDLLPQLKFSSAFGTFMAGTAADLVAVQILPGYGSWITHLLCRESDPDYASCESQYRRGLYQSSDGREVDTTLKLVDGGGRIDPKTFKRAQLDATAPDASATKTIAAAPIAAEPIANSTPTDTDQRRSDQERTTLNPATGRDEVAQLQKLKQLLDKELITQDEYDRKRKEILDHL
jgi:hypothetical protein